MKDTNFLLKYSAELFVNKVIEIQYFIVFYYSEIKRAREMKLKSK